MRSAVLRRIDLIWGIDREDVCNRYRSPVRRSSASIGSNSRKREHVYSD